MIISTPLIGPPPKKKLNIPKPKINKFGNIFLDPLKNLLNCQKKNLVEIFFWSPQKKNWTAKTQNERKLKKINPAQNFVLNPSNVFLPSKKKFKPNQIFFGPPLKKVGPQKKFKINTCIKFFFFSSWQWWNYLHWSRDSVSPVCGIIKRLFCNTKCQLSFLDILSISEWVDSTSRVLYSMNPTTAHGHSRAGARTGK